MGARALDADATTTASASARVSAGQDPALEALREGALTLSRQGNQVASLAVLWAAVGLAPDDLVLHRWLAARLANLGNRDAAAGEYARYVELMLERGDVARAELELRYGRATLGDMPALRTATLRLAAARALETALPTATTALPASPRVFARALRRRLRFGARSDAVGRSLRRELLNFATRLFGFFGPPRPH
jgi:hypothetical protein